MNIWLWIHTLNAKSTLVMQQESDLKRTSKSTSQGLSANKTKVLEWPSQRPDLKAIKML